MFAMAKLKFGAWIPTYAWSGRRMRPQERQAHPRVRPYQFLVRGRAAPHV